MSALNVRSFPSTPGEISACFPSPFESASLLLSPPSPISRPQRTADEDVVRERLAHTLSGLLQSRARARPVPQRSIISLGERESPRIRGRFTQIQARFFPAKKTKKRARDGEENADERDGEKEREGERRKGEGRARGTRTEARTIPVRLSQ